MTPRDRTVAPPVFDATILARYDRSGPRYTSYPTAPHFNDTFGPADYLAAVGKAGQAPGREASFYFHLPFCRRVCYFCACNTIFTNDRNTGRAYTDDLKREMDLVLDAMRHRPAVRQLHWGGGTPTFSPPEILDELGRAIHERLTFAPGAEVSVEVDPRETTPAHLDVLAGHGFNRISLGVQDFDADVQKAVNRVQPWEMTKGVVDAARARGFGSVNIDLIYGLPRQTPAVFEATLDRLLELDPDRVALFNFAYLPEMVRHQRVIKPEQLPPPADKLAMFRRGIERLTGAGLVFIGMDHFARADDELALALEAGTLGRNFQGYTTHAGLDLFGFGVSAIGQVGDTYAQNQKSREAWRAALDAGVAPVARGITLMRDDEIRRAVIMELMSRFALDREKLARRFGIDVDDYFADEFRRLSALEEDGLVTVTPAAITVTAAGRLLVRNVAMIFDAWLAGEAAPRYSRTV
ncbi:MAG TPA: oxygen-independent coproporphyrinogen III oxidase [Candidatus Eisenbacteria bacterium]